MNKVIVIYAFIFAMLYAMFSHSDITTIALLILLSIWIYWIVLHYGSSKESTQIPIITNVFDEEIDQRRQETKNILSDQFYNTILSKKGLRYLKYNTALIDVAKNLLYIRMFDRARYQDLLWNLNTLQKIYIYILLKRYKVASHMPMFEETRKSIIELMHSMILIVPLELKHTYGLNPIAELEKSIQQFVVVSNTMFDTLRNFANNEMHVSHIPIQSPYPVNFMNGKHSLP